MIHAGRPIGDPSEGARARSVPGRLGMVLPSPWPPIDNRVASRSSLARLEVDRA